MAQSGFTPIQLFRTSTAAAVPTAGSLAAGELAINLTDEKLYFKNAAGTVKLLASTDTLGTVTSVAVSGGTTGLTTSGGPITTSGTITLAGTLGVANGGTGTATAFTAGSVVFAGASGVYSQNNANFFWDNTNSRLGIGTASPSFKLDVSGTLRSTGVATLGTGATTTIATIGDSSTTNTRIIQFGRASAVTDIVNIQGINAGVGAADISLQASGGNVGIGTSSPASKLDVNGGISVGRTTASQSIIAFNGDAVNAQQIRLVMNGTDGVIDATRNSGTSPNLIFQTDTTERMRIDSSGNVGIGTSSPGAKLEVAGGDLRVTGTGTGNIGITLKRTAGTTSDWYQYIPSGSDAFVWFQGGVGAERMRIDSSGNVGIGTSSPGYKVDVAGIVNTSQSFRYGASYFGSASDYFTSRYLTNMIYNVPTGSGFVWAINGGDTMTLNPNGNVGIGTSSNIAGVGLELKKSGAYLGLNTTTTGFSLVRGYDNGTERWSMGQIGFGGADGMAFYTGTANTERMRIDSSGNVGIGTTIPGAYGGRLTVGDPGNAFSNNVLLLTRYATATLIADGVTAANGAQLDVSWASGGQGPLRFTFSSTERMRLTSAGNLLVGTTTAAYAAGERISVVAASTTNGMGIVVTGSGAKGIGIYNGNSSGATSGTMLEFQNSSSGVVGSVSSNGTTTSYNVSSDARLKHDIVDAPEASNLIDAIQVRSFKWNADDSEQRYGFVAQELLEVAPEAVSQPVNPDDMMGVDYSKLVPMLVKELQSLRARVAQLEGN